jgi:hypothetical protein
MDCAVNSRLTAQVSINKFYNNFSPKMNVTLADLWVVAIFFT